MRETITYADVLVATVGNLLPKGSDKVFIVSVRIEYDAREADQPSVCGFLHLMCYAKTNYMRVYAAFTDRPTSSYPQLNWVKVCHHDSAWRDDGIRSQLRQASQALREEAASVFQEDVEALREYLSIDKMCLEHFQELGLEEVLQRQCILGRLDYRKALA